VRLSPCLLLLILLYSALTVHAQNAFVHVIRPGESLFSISKKYGVTVLALQNANRIADPRKIQVGQKLLIPVQPSREVRPLPPPPANLPVLVPTERPAPSRPSPPLPSRRYLFLDAVKDVIDTPVLVSNRWSYIVLHHSGTRRGNARIYDAAHRERGMENGLAYHFVIGNGVDSPDGQIEVGRRWLKQLKGGHVAIEATNQIALGVCFVGNFNDTRPTKKQLAAAIELVTYLRQICGPKIPRVLTHTEIHRYHTECPGRLFPTTAFHRFFPD
jgi:LysM repeat protein